MSIVNTKGVDISYANGNIDLAKVKSAGYGWVMIRCGYGDDLSSQDDSQFESNVRKAESLGMPWGVYLYSYATNQTEARSEVAHIVRLLKNKKPTLPVALDVEDSNYYQKYGVYSKSALTPIVKTILEGIKSAGYYPALYTGKYWLDGYDGVSGLIDRSVWSNYDIWIACWTKTCLYSGSNLGMWQYGGSTNVIESNSIPGVGVIDKDLAYKDYPTIIKNGGYNNWPKSSDPTPPEPAHVPLSDVPDVYYRVRTGGRWLPEVKNLEWSYGDDFAGIRGKAITDVAIKVTKGTIKYRVHVKGGSWLSWITKYDTSDIMGYAGIGSPIDAIEVYYYTPSDIANSQGYYKAKYRVSPMSNGYYDWQYDTETSGGQDGYAGSFGKTIDRLQICLAK